jgi:hypothetical protein
MIRERGSPEAKRGDRGLACSGGGCLPAPFDRKPSGRGRCRPVGRPRTRRQAARAPTIPDDRARPSWPGRPPRAGNPLAAQDHSKVRSLRSRPPDGTTRHT